MSDREIVSRYVRALSPLMPFAVPRHNGEIVSLLNGSPAPEALPVEDLRTAASWALGDPVRAEQTLAYGPNAGDPRLRALIAAMHEVSPERIVITNGALHGIALTLRAILDADDIVAMDDPAFPDALRAVETVGGRVLPIPVDSEGIDVAELARHLRRGVPVKAVYTVPDFHNPTGVSLSESARTRLVDLAEHFGFLVLSDNPYRRIDFSGRPRPDLTSDTDRVVSVGTFSKTLGPGLRLGWVVAPEWLAPHLVTLRSRSDFQPPALSQRVTAHLLARDGWYDALLDRATRVYRERAALTADYLGELGDRIAVRPAAGGFFAWFALDRGLDPLRVEAAARRAGVVYSRGDFYDPTGTGRYRDHIRIAYSSGSKSRLAEGLGRLGDAIRSH